MGHWFRALPSLVGSLVLATGRPAQANLIANGSFEIPFVARTFPRSLTIEPVPNLPDSAGRSRGQRGRRYTWLLSDKRYRRGPIARPGWARAGNHQADHCNYARQHLRSDVLLRNNPFGTIPSQAVVDILGAAGYSPRLTHFGTQQGGFAGNWAASGAIPFVATTGTDIVLCSSRDSDPFDAGGILLDAISVEPVPEPTSFAMFLAGLVVTGLRCRNVKGRKPSSH